MTQQYYNSKIALFLLTQSRHLYEIRDNLPGGFSAFDLMISDIKQDSLYTFIDYICDNRPFDCAIKTCYAEVYYCKYSWSWKITDESEKTNSVRRLITLLNEFTDKANMLRAFDKFGT